MMLLLFFFLLFLRQSPAEHCHPDDIAAILKFKNSFSNPQLLPSWTLDMDCCYIFDCDESNRIVDLTITYSDLSGTIPDAVADLTHLQTLRLKKMPFLAGEIPPAIGKMTQLVTLQISWTNISGHVPRFLANLQNLKIFDLSFNKLSGSIPPSLATFPDIIGLDLSRNQLTGPIPESFGHFPGKLPSISLSRNRLSGKIPASLANVNFFRVDISRNNLSGDASMFFGDSKSSDSIDISRNNFEFNFSQVRFMAPLVTLDISHNKIYGNIPSQITDAVVLQVLNVSYNRLCGEIPTGWKLSLLRQLTMVKLKPILTKWMFPNPNTALWLSQDLRIG
ncbi:hypothetical protein F0562_018683 [Nyssa sinensis]|uniref:Leucine-rich repeat-containing N-terminal plant-type domain-containing protein n=1 Tax=Nyssa sinensis TaxID=561372 RepID=A0A5J4ZD88_9ASTE|nr:hypothetical protein F0562_018683 [Nyssa sinensis]